MSETLQWQQVDLLAEVERRSGTPVSACFQCHKCSTGCPIGPDMDLLSSQIMRLVHLGAEDELLGSKSIWLCASCEACSTRCPMEIDIAAVMDTLRMMAVERQVAPGCRVTLGDKHAKEFNRSFLGSVRRHGRVFEFGMLAMYKMRCLDFFSDVGKFPKMLAKGKISLLPNRSGAAGEVQQVFRRAEEEEKKR
ncbi:MAG TPA: 4Fe-4S dicluster domain-containing protein [Thermoguttaceae bacterium]|nr:4Fe-4S dicluster domain-containing protein [Thermoguttaceae bacterium]